MIAFYTITQNTIYSKQFNTDNAAIKQPNIDNTSVEQPNNDNTSEEQSNNESTFVMLPKWLKSLRCITNPLNNTKGGDKECFQYSIGLSKDNEIGKNCGRINKIQLFLRHFNFEDINYPIKKEDYETFERNNESISLNVLKLDNERKRMYYHFKSKNTGRNIKIHLLLVENKHYTYVTKPHILLKYLKN